MPRGQSLIMIPGRCIQPDCNSVWVANWSFTAVTRSPGVGQLRHVGHGGHVSVWPDGFVAAVDRWRLGGFFAGVFHMVFVRQEHRGVGGCDSLSALAAWCILSLASWRLLMFPVGFVERWSEVHGP